jgi:hypothetical protein
MQCFPYFYINFAKQTELNFVFKIEKDINQKRYE